MSIVNAKEILLRATAEHYAVGAFNITNLIQMEAVIEAAVAVRAPVIVQTSVAPSKLLGSRVIVAAYRALADHAPVPVCLHLDHCTEVDYCKQCADAGYTNIMIDASRMTFDENVRQTKDVVEHCHELGTLSVEGELGTVSGVEDQVAVADDDALLCDPEAAVKFAELTGVDLLAPAIGTAHGIYKTENPKLDFERLATVCKLLNGERPRVPVVIHGGTGLKHDVVRRLVSLGGSKFNVSTELKHTLIDTTFDYISAHRDEYNPGKIDSSVKEAIRQSVTFWINLLGSAGKA